MKTCFIYLNVCSGGLVSDIVLAQLVLFASLFIMPFIAGAVKQVDPQ